MGTETRTLLGVVEVSKAGVDVAAKTEDGLDYKEGEGKRRVVII